MSFRDFPSEPEDFLRFHGTDGFVGVNGCVAKVTRSSTVLGSFPISPYYYMIPLQPILAELDGRIRKWDNRMAGKRMHILLL